MTLPIFLLFAQALPGPPPPLGFVPGKDQRMHPLYGFRDNFMLGDAAEEDVISAATFDGVTVQKRPKEIRWSAVHSTPSGSGPAIFAWDAASRTTYAWLPDTGQMISSEGAIRLPVEVEGIFAMTIVAPGRIRLLQRNTGLQLLDVDLESPRVVRIENVAATEATIDSRGNLWTADDHGKVSCGVTRWKLDEPLVSITPLLRGWVLLNTGTLILAARCDTADLSFVPAP